MVMERSSEKQSSAVSRADRLTDRTLAALKRRGTEEERFLQQRRYRRYGFQRHPVKVVLVPTEASSAVEHLVQTWDLSKGGISFLLAGFVHRGTACQVHLVGLDRAVRKVLGVVVSCDYVEGRIHIVGVKFSDPIEPAYFSEQAHSVRVLIVESNELLVKVARHHFAALGAFVEDCSGLDEALQIVSEGAFDLILLIFSQEAPHVRTTASQLRETGYCGVIVAAADIDSEGVEQACLDSGCDLCIPLPLSPSHLESVLALVKTKPMYSIYSQDPCMAEVIDYFVGLIPERVRSIEQALRGDDLAELVSVCQYFAREADVYGFPELARAADRVVVQMAEAVDATDSQREVWSLLRCCNQVRSWFARSSIECEKQK